MRKILNTHRLILIAAMLLSGMGTVVVGQTTANTEVRNQAKSIYQYKNFPPDTVLSPPVLFSVITAPNFQISFSIRDTNVFMKETVQVRIVYKNIGNEKADSATINGVLPPAGLRFVPGSTKGIISGGTVTWKVFDINAGQTDSVAVKMVVDSLLIANTQLELQGTIDWASSQASASAIFVVNSFPRLDVSTKPAAEFVGSGRSMTYDIVVRNSGNIQANGVTLIDTLSALASFQTSSINPDSIRGGGKILVWKFGNLPPFSQRSVSVTVGTPPNRADGTIANSALAYASNVASPAVAKITTPIVPIAPKSMTLVAEPEYIFGKIGSDSARITVELRDSIGQILPDGVPVQFTTNRGDLSNSLRFLSTTIHNGKAVTYLRPENITNEIVKTAVDVVGGSIFSGTRRDSIFILMYPGAVSGIVVNGYDRLPFSGAIAQVSNQSNMIVGADTTKSDGKFFIPLNKDVMSYVLEIFVIDKFGDTITTKGTIDPTQFPRPPVQIPNTISGRIQYRVSGLPVPAEGVTVYLDSVTTTGGSFSTARKKNLPTGIYARVQEQQTDAFGRFKFENLKPARYVVTVDSTEFPRYKGYSFIADTVSGTFTVNLSIDIEQDSSVIFTIHSPSTVNAGDTLRYSLTYNNTGNLTQYAVQMVDTIPAQAQFVSATQGKYASLVFDSTSRIVVWSKDSIIASENDSVSIKLLLSRNIPDSTVLRNRAWFSTNVNPSLSALSMTTIRSAPILSFGNMFSLDSTIAGDSVYKKIWFSNTGTDSITEMRIVDSLFSAGKTRISINKTLVDSVVVLDSIVTIVVGVIAPGESDTITVRYFTDFSLPPGTKIISSAHLLKEDSSLFRSTSTLTLMENKSISSYLTVVKTGNKKVAEIGDIVTYQVNIGNTSPTALFSIGVYDLLPHAFRYIKNSARYNGRPVEPALNTALNSLTWNFPDTIQVGKKGMLVYQMAIGADAMESEGINTAYASAVTNSGFSLLSQPSQWQVTVRPGVFTEKGLLIGKVFYDDNRNAFQEPGETGLKGVELWLEDGTKITTGDDGKYSLPEVKPGQHVIRVNERTLPAGSTLLLGSTKFANDPTSQFIRLTESGIAKANFFVARTIADSIRQTTGKVNMLTTLTQSIPKYVFKDTTLRYNIDTVEFLVSFVFSGSRFLQSIEVNEALPAEMRIVPSSATFNGRSVEPIVLNNNVQWRLGRAQDIAQGLLRYKVFIEKVNGRKSLLRATTVKVMTFDSAVVESPRMVTENIVQQVDKNKIESSDVMKKSVNPVSGTQMADSVVVSEGDDVYFKISLFIDPKKEFTAVKIIDSLETNFLLNERSFTINGMPLPTKNLSVRIRSSALSARTPAKKEEIEFLRIANVDLTELIRKGVNEITYSARLHAASRDTVFRKTAFASVTNSFKEETITRSNDLKIIVRASRKIPSMALETRFIDTPRPVSGIDEKVAEAMKLVEALQQSSTKSVVMEGITFEAGKAILTAEAKVVLDNIAKMLSTSEKLSLQINGHTDNTGNASANRKISVERAKEVRKYLIGKGIRPERLYAQGFGSDKPIATNKTEEGRAKNRRVEFSKPSQ